jgi:hypothetical protein
MGFASSYLEQRALFPEFVKEAPEKNTGIIVIVPAYNEPGITTLLNSLASCSEPDCSAEVIIIINAPENASPESKKNNLITRNQIESWKKENSSCFFRVFACMVTSIKDWGVGLARKTGMDEAVRRFNSINRHDGIIVSLDADCLVAGNYFTAIRSEFVTVKDRSACSIYFEHPLTGSDFSEKVYRNISLYELHLRFFYLGLVSAGYPYVFHTIGSAIAVKALSYVKAGGMNRRQAGEDFYFIQKLVPAGGFFNLISTTVYPSPRPSFRVPFGTGNSIARLGETEESVLFTYNLEAFQELRVFFGMTDKIFKSKAEELPEVYALFPGGLKSFMKEKEFTEKILEIENNTSGSLSFKKRFYGWFNMFKIVKYLNFVHQEVFEKKAVQISALELLASLSIYPDSKDPLNLLLLYRKLERNEA